MSMRQQAIDKAARELFATGLFSTRRDALAASEHSYELFMVGLRSGIVVGVVLGAVGMLLGGILYNAVFAQ